MRTLKRHFFKLFLAGFLTAGALFVYAYFFLLAPPVNFSESKFIEIQRGSTLSSIAQTLAEKDIITSQDLFKIGVYLSGKQDQLKFGTYYFPEPERMEEVVRKIVQGDFDVPTVRVTIFEGQAAFQYAPVIARALPGVSEQELLDAIRADQKEGFLYPDTYFFPQNADAQDVMRIMEKNFDNKIAPYKNDIENSKYTLSEILAMASLVENEAGSASFETKQRVAGVLWKRVEVGMLIQADAVFPFIYQRPLPRVLNIHLESDSPYNLYKYTGLPPGPISSPSIDSIRAALDPVITQDLFYLTGFDGKFYYARTNAGHEQNRRLYLNYRN